MVRFLAVPLVVAGCQGGLSLEPNQNYSFESTIALEDVVLEAQSDMTVNWAAVTTDFRGRTFDGTPDQVSILGCPFSKEEIRGRIDANLFAQDSCQVSYLYDTTGEQSQVAASEFDIIGNALVPANEFLANDTNWLISILNTGDGRDEALMSAFVNFTTDVTATTVALTDTSSTLNFEVSLDGERVRAGGGTRVDWGAVEVDTFGNPFDPIRGDELLVARFDVESVDEIETGFLRLDELAAELYRADVFGVTRIDASLAQDGDGNAFAGFTSEGIWLVGVGCKTCLNPAPLILSVVDP